MNDSSFCLTVSSDPISDPFKRCCANSYSRGVNRAFKSSVGGWTGCIFPRVILTIIWDIVVAKYSACSSESDTIVFKQTIT